MTNFSTKTYNLGQIFIIKKRINPKANLKKVINFSITICFDVNQNYLRNVTPIKSNNE